MFDRLKSLTLFLKTYKSYHSSPLWPPQRSPFFAHSDTHHPQQNLESTTSGRRRRRAEMHHKSSIRRVNRQKIMHPFGE